MDSELKKGKKNATKLSVSIAFLKKKKKDDDGSVEHSSQRNFFQSWYCVTKNI